VHDLENNKISLLLLQSLEYWIPDINLMTDDKSGISREGLSALYHLVAITLRNGRANPDTLGSFSRHATPNKWSRHYQVFARAIPQGWEHVIHKLRRKRRRMPLSNGHREADIY
jgi:hypothetical protein